MQAETRSGQVASCSPRCAALVPVPARRRPRAFHGHVACLVAAVDAAADAAAQPVVHAEPFKYTRLPCTSPCPADDLRCHQVEALFQHVLNYPRLPTRVCQWLPMIQTDMGTITRTIEGLSRKFGQELTLHMLRRSPHILLHDCDTVLSRADNVRAMLDCKPVELFTILRKNPVLLCMEFSVTRQRYNALHKVLPLSHEAIKTLVRKYPIVLNFRTTSIEEMVDNLRQISYTRVHWQEDFDCMTPSTLAFFFRDNRDILDRLEFLAATGSAPFISLREVFKMTGNVFANKYRGFDTWLQERKLMAQRRQMLAQRREAQQAQQAALLAELQAKGSVVGGASGAVARQAGAPRSEGQGRQSRRH